MKRKLIIGGIIAVVAIILGVTIAGGAMGEKRIAKHMELGNKYLEEGNYEQAILAYEAVIKIDENSIEARTAMANVYIGLDDMGQAETIAREAITIDETQAGPWDVLTEMYQQTKTKPELAQLYQEAFDKTGDTQFSNWLQAHTPEKPVMNYESGAYEEYITVELTNQYEDNVDVKYNLNDEAVDTVNELQNGEYSLNIKATNDYDLSSTNEYQYSIEFKDYVIEFVDPEFERMLRMAMNKLEGDIYKSELDEIKTLEIYGHTHADINRKQELHFTFSDSINHCDYSINGTTHDDYGDIKMMDDIIHFSNLESLTVVFNKISDIRILSECVDLKSLYLIGNQVNDINILKHLTQLEMLMVSGNKINNIDSLSSLTNLNCIFLNNNEISDISALRGLNKLNVLAINDNQISNIDSLFDLNNLTGLYLENNQISDINALSNLTDLTILRLNDNQISNINSLAGMTNLTRLYLENNQINDISVLSNLIKLERLELTNNPITDYSLLDYLINAEINR